jgi:outer membrane protein assembly factor BamB
MALCFTVAACGLFGGGKGKKLEPLKPNPVPEVAATTEIERGWSFSIGGPGQAGLRPALGATAVYVANPGGRVAAVDLESGRSIWSKNLDLTISGGVGTGEGLVMVGGLDGEVVALDSRDGAEVWRATVNSEVTAPPRASGGVVVVRTIDGGVTGLSTISGETRWHVRRDEPSLTLRGSGPPLIQQGVAVMGFADGKLAAMNVADGAILWEITVSRPRGTNEVERMIDVDASPLLQGNVLYAVSFQGNIAAYALGANQVMWSREISSHTDIAADPDYLYVSDSTGRLRALDRATGEQVWVQEQLLRRRLSGPAVVGDYLVVGDFEGHLYVIDKSDGSLVGHGSFGDQIEIQPLVRNDRVLIMTENGVLRSISIGAGGG